MVSGWEDDSLLRFNNDRFVSIDVATGNETPVTWPVDRIPDWQRLAWEANAQATPGAPAPRGAQPGVAEPARDRRDLVAAPATVPVRPCSSRVRHRAPSSSAPTFRLPDFIEWARPRQDLDIA